MLLQEQLYFPVCYKKQVFFILVLRFFFFCLFHFNGVVIKSILLSMHLHSSPLSLSKILALILSMHIVSESGVKDLCLASGFISYVFRGIPGWQAFHSCQFKY